MSDINRRRESGYALQTLIITAVLVAIAAVVAVVIVAVNRGSRSDLAVAGRSGSEAACAPHEVFDSSYAASGIGGPNDQGGVESKAVGCKPHCATWEFVATPSAGGEYKLGGTGEGSPIGGPEGKGGVFSSNIGCFAPCYWEVGTPRKAATRTEDLVGIRVNADGTLLEGHPSNRHNPSSRLLYYDDNRPPAEGEIRLGVTYRRILANSPHSSLHDITASDLQEIPYTRRSQGGDSWDGEPFYYHVGAETQQLAQGKGTLYAPGTPLTAQMIANGVPTVHTPNWRSDGVPQMNRINPSWQRFNTWWEDGDWQIMTDPESEICEIVYTPTNRLVCSSANSSCLVNNEVPRTP